MTALVENLIGLPDWPALLSVEQAAAYCGVSADTFLVLVAKGELPKPYPLSIRRKLWYRAAIDETLGSKGANDAEARKREWHRQRKDRS